MGVIYENWERLVTATLRREELRQIAMRTPSDVSSASSSASASSSSSRSLLEEGYSASHLQLFRGLIAFHSTNKWQLHFNESKQLQKLMVVDFAAKWCGPCNFMDPVLMDMAGVYTDVDFVKIDVDDLNDVVQEFKVRAMPTFLLLKQGKEVDRVIGARKDELEMKILMHRD